MTKYIGKKIRHIPWKKILSLVLALLVLFTSIRFLFIKPGKVQAADVLIGMNEGYGDTTADTNSTITTSTVTNAVWKTEDLCKVGKCLYFDGTGDYVTHADDANLDMGSGDTVTIEGWFRTPDITSGTRTLVAKEEATGADGGYRIDMNSSGFVVFGIDNDNGTFPSDSVTSTAAYDDNVWHHFAAVKNGSTSITLYVDGISVGTPDLSPAADVSNDDAFYIGMYNGASNGWSGFIDEVKVYRSARTAAEVKADYNGETPSRGTAVSFAPDQSYISNGLLGYWKLDESNPSSGLSLVQSYITYPGNSKTGVAVNQNDLIIVSASYHSTSAASVSDNASGGTNTYNSAESLVFNTLEKAWVWYAVAKATETLTITVTSLNDVGMSVHVVRGNNTTLASVMDVKNSSTTAVGTSHTGASITTTNTNDYLYVHFANESAAWGAITDNGSSFVQETNDDTHSHATWDRIVSNTGSYSAIVNTTNSVYLANIIVAFKGAAVSGGDATDSSGNNLTLTNNGTTTYLAGKFGMGSEHVPASTQYLSTATTINSVKSISFWVNPDANTNYYASLTSGAYITSSSGTLSATGFTNPKIYVNGVESTTIVANAWQLVTVTTDTAINANQFYVGRQGSNYFDGTMDEVRLYNRTLTPADVTKLYSWAPGPVGSWKLDENTGTAANDSTGNANTGTITAGTGAFVPGKFGSAYHFDDATTSISAGSAQKLDNLDNSGMSLSAWIYPVSQGEGSAGVIMAKNVGTTPSAGWLLQLAGTNALTFTVDGSTDLVRTTSNSVVTLNAWNHVEMTWDGVITTAASVHIFINGVETTYATTTNGASSVDDGSSTFYIGNDSTSARTFDGTIDDPKVYNYVRSNAQVIEDMNAGHPAPGSPVGSSVAYWKFDEGALNTCPVATDDFCDSSINANGLAFSTTTGGYTNDGKFGKAFHGTGAVWASRADDADFDFAAADDATFSLWFRSNSTTNPGSGVDEYLLTKGTITNTGTAGYAIYADNNGKINFGIKDDAAWGASSPGTPSPDDTVTSSSDIYDATWHHIAAVKTGTSRIDLYVDGILQSSDTSIAATATLANAITSYIADDDGDATNSFNGDIDDLKIFRSALSSDQVKLLYNQSSQASLGSLSTNATGSPSNASVNSYCPPGQGTTCVAPVGHWKLDENTGGNVFDVSGTGDDGTMGSSASSDSADPAWTTGKYGSGVKTNTGDYVNIPDNSNYSIVTTGALTVETWVKFEANTGSTSQVINKNGFVGVAGYEWYLGRQTGGTIQVYTGALNGTSYITTNTSTTVPLNQWTHLAYTIDTTIATPILIIYINGVQASTDTVQDGGTLANGTMPVRFGTNSDSGNDTVGSIDDVRIYNYARTQAQIDWDYNRGGPMGWWKMDETSWTNDCSTATVFDSSGNGIHGKSCPNTTGPTGGSAGKFNKAGTFDGSNDYINLTNSASVKGLSQFTISAWINPTTLPTVNYQAVYSEEVEDDISTWRVGLGIEKANALGCTGDNTFNFHFRTGTQASTRYNVCGTTTLTTGTWYHIVGIFNSDTDVHTTYLNGKLNGTLSQAVGAMASTNPSLLPLIGKDPDTSGTYVFNGLIDDVRIYNYALTPQQIKMLTNEGSAVRFGP